MICPHCDYEWEPRVANPKKCPKCQKWLPVTVVKVQDEDVPRYMMRFVPYGPDGRLKKGAPKVGGRRGLDEGDVVMLPLECRWESWLELVDESSVPEAELKKDQKLRDEFMVTAMAAAAARAKELQSVRVTIE